MMEPPDPADPPEPAASSPEPAAGSPEPAPGQPQRGLGLAEHVPTRLERTLAQLVAAGIAQPEHLAALLGLAPQHIARPLRTLTLFGKLEADADGAGLRLTLAGRAWLGLGVSPPVAADASAHPAQAAPAAAPPAGSGSPRRGDRAEPQPRLVTDPMRSEPRLLAERASATELLAEEETGLRLLPPAPRRVALVVDADRPVDGAEGGGEGGVAERSERRGVRSRWAAPRIRLPGRMVAWPGGARLALRRSTVALSEVCLGVAGVQLSPTLSRRIAALAASSVVLVIGVRAGLPAWSLGGMPTFAPAVSTAPDQARPATPGQAVVPQATPVSLPPAVAPQPAERWVVVDHTNGLGLVLRPAPASPARVLTLQDGARIRVTGDAVQQAGRAWLPVASQTGKTGWVAADFVTPSP